MNRQTGNSAFSQRQLRVGELIKQSLGQIFLKDEAKLNYILKDLKIKITDLWKKENVINLSIPLSIRVKFKYKNLQDLDKLRKILYKINIINQYSLEEFSTNNSFFKIYYYGNPKKLAKEFLKFGYQLLNDQGDWILHKHG